MEGIPKVLLIAAILALPVSAEDYCSDDICDPGDRHIDCNNSGVSFSPISLLTLKTYVEKMVERENKFSLAALSEVAPYEYAPSESRH